ncbi:glycosyltransferase [Reyranella sp.]|uniref:glycosyltransferase n=1 Tax=Reyranella sp. TaxID=1929291 RepID=UPI003D11A356
MAGKDIEGKKLASAAVEEILCHSTALGRIDDLVRRSPDAWTVTYPGLDSLLTFEGETRRLRICIATEDIVGPVRNGGIGTTYAALAELLANLGHEVTILYLKGHEVENETIEHWADYYAVKKIRFMPVPNYARLDRYPVGGDRWAHASYNMFRYLTEHPVDVVHVSEWRAAGYFSLLAKRQGLAFRDTLFIVKTSSPWLWNRLYGLQPFQRLDDLAKVHAERRSVELADMVIGGSLHLLRWMHSQGYDMPRDRIFVQPNVATFEHLASLARSRTWEQGSRHPIDEIVFFGRLEARKGLLIFIQAIKRLIRQGTKLPAKISFMGKPGEPVLERTGEDVVGYIRAETATWPTTVEILSDFQQYEGVEYLLGGNRLAIMPSLIENSSLAVYEAVICKVPFIASDSGGTPELVDAADHRHVLCPAHPVPLADRIALALERGGYVAAPSFDNEENLDQWRRFHQDLGRGLLAELLPVDSHAAAPPTKISVCIYHPESDEQLTATLASLKAQNHPQLEIRIAIDTQDTEAVERARAKVGELGLSATIVPTFDFDAGLAFNALADDATGEFVFFLWSGATLNAAALSTLADVAARCRVDLLTYFFRVVYGESEASRPYLNVALLGDFAQAFFHTDVTPLPLFVRREAFLRLGGFTRDYRVLGHDHEFVSKAQLAGLRCQSVLRELGTVDGWSAERLRERGYDRSVSEFRAARPQLAAAPLALREMLIMAKGLQKNLGRRGRLGGSTALAVQASKGGAARNLMQQLLSGLTPKFAGRDRRNQAKAEKRAQRITVRAAAHGGGLVHLVNDQPVKDQQGANSQRAVRNLAIHWHSDADGRRYVGRLFGVHRGVVYGWVRDEDRPDRMVEVEGDFGDGRSRVVPANIGSTAILPARIGMRGHGFALPIWRGPYGFRGDWRSTDVVLRVKGTDLTIGELSVAADPRALDASGYDGHCDLVDSTIRGWAWQPAHPENSVDIAAFVDGKFLGRTTANYVRDDLRSLQIGTGAYGFAISIPRQLRDGTPHRIEVVVADSGVLLNRGRLHLVGDKLVSAK